MNEDNLEIKELEKVEEGIVESNKTTSQDTANYINLSHDAINRAYNCYFNLRTTISSGTINFEGLSPATEFFRNLVAMKVALIFTKLPEYQVSSDASKLIKQNKKNFESIFAKAAEKLILYGQVCTILNENHELELVDDEFFVADNNFLALRRALSEEEQSLVEASGIEISDEVYLVFTGNKRQVRVTTGEYIDGVTNYTNSGMALTDDAFIYYTWNKFCTLEWLHGKENSMKLALKLIAVTDASNQNAVKELFKGENECSVVVLKSTEYGTTDITKLLQYLSNAPIAESLNIVKEQIVNTEQQIIKLAKLDTVISGLDKDNPVETRIAAQNRIQLSTLLWNKLQYKFNNFVESCLQGWLKAQGVPVEEANTLCVNGVSLLEQDQKKQEYLQDVATITSLIKQANTASTQAEAQLNYQLASEYAKQSGLSDEVIATLEAMVKEQESNRVKVSQQPQEPNLEEQQAIADIEKTKADTQKSLAEAEKSKVESQFKGEEVRIAAEDQAQQTMDSNRAILEDKAKGVING